MFNYMYPYMSVACPYSYDTIISQMQHLAYSPKPGCEDEYHRGFTQGASENYDKGYLDGYMECFDPGRSLFGRFGIL